MRLKASTPSRETWYINLTDPSGLALDDLADAFHAQRAWPPWYYWYPNATEVIAGPGKVIRKFLLSVPEGVGAVGTAPVPLLLSFHGQYLPAEFYANNSGFEALGAKHGFISAFPQGMGDGRGDDNQGAGWNVGTAGDNATCLPKGVGKEYGCYLSCRKANRCGRCDWSTCFDDLAFVKAMLDEVTQAYCIDMDRIYVQGSSNGGMMVHYLVQEMPDTFAAAAVWYGLPLLGYGVGAQARVLREEGRYRETALMQLHGRSDTCIPPGGGVSEDGWIYEPLRSMQNAWSAIHGCAPVARSLTTRWSGGKQNLSCSEFEGCSTGRRVMNCLYDGGHSDPKDRIGEELTVWFLLQFRREALAASRSLAVVNRWAWPPLSAVAATLGLSLSSVALGCYLLHRFVRGDAKYGPLSLVPR